MAGKSTNPNDRICAIRFLPRLARFNSAHGRISGDHPDDGRAGGVFILPPTFGRLRGQQEIRRLDRQHMKEKKEEKIEKKIVYI